MAGMDVGALQAECLRFMGATLAWRTRAAAIGDDKLAEFAQRAAAIAGSLHAVLDLHAAPERALPGELHCGELIDWVQGGCPTVQLVAEQLGAEPDHG